MVALKTKAGTTEAIVGSRIPSRKCHALRGRHACPDRTAHPLMRRAATLYNFHVNKFLGTVLAAVQRKNRSNSLDVVTAHHKHKRRSAGLKHGYHG